MSMTEVLNHANPELGSDPKITPEMRDAGVRVLADIYDLVPPGLAELVVGEIFTAMAACQPKPPEVHELSDVAS
jgi:hypothetical protein